MAPATTTARGRNDEQHDQSLTAANSAAASDLGAANPWQSLVLPVILACVIFLVALWTRQISLAATNDTILMIMILMGLFIIMSGLALWLSCDQYLDEEQEQAREAQAQETLGEDETLPPCRCHHHRHIHGHNNHRHHHHNHHHHHHNHNQHSAEHESSLGHSSTTNSTNERRCQKCAVSVIDCQPPDYYSAVMNSMPIHHYLSLEHHRKSSKDGQANKDGDVGGENQLYVLPPSYEELQKEANRLG